MFKNINLKPALLIFFIFSLGQTQNAFGQKKKGLAKIPVTIQKTSTSKGLIYLTPEKSLPRGYRPQVGKTVIVNFGKTKVVALKVMKSTNKKIIGKIVKQYLSKLPPRSTQLTLLFRGKQLKSLVKTVPTKKKVHDPFVDSDEFEKNKDESPNQTKKNQSGADNDDPGPHREFTIAYRTEPKGILGAFAINFFGKFMTEFAISRAESNLRSYFPIDLSLRTPLFKPNAFEIQPIAGLRYNSTLGYDGAAKDKTGLLPLYGLSLQYPRFGSIRLRADFTGDSEDHGFTIGLIWGPKDVDDLD
jgi:hypothetical protein